MAYSEFLYDDATGAGSNPSSGAGNVTQELRWDSTRAATFPGATQSGLFALTLSATNAIQTTRTYAAGDLVTETDPRGIQKVFQYNNPAIPYPTDLFEASGTSVQEHWQLGWDVSSGLLASETDPNNGLTTGGYDPRGRFASMNQAGLRHTSTTYDDSAQTALTKRDLRSINDGIVQTTTWTDDLGRVWKTQTTDGTCVAGIQTISLQQTPASGTYGGFTWKLVSNPFCALSDPTMGWTRTQIDPLGRVVEVAHFTGSALPAPWGSNSAAAGAVETSYTANQYTTNDEASISRTITDDGFGRLSAVLDGTGVNTLYTYDALDHLTGVSQGSQQRSFVYTSLGRLQSATNPENGIINYTWDDNGNLATRSDSRVSVTLNSAPYDGLNRLVMKTYSDGTPTVTYCYDGQTFTGTAGQCTGTLAAPFIGRLTQVASSVSTTNYSNYDLVGRVLASTQTTNGQPYPFLYSYNMLDGLTSEGFPSGRTVSYTYDMGGRVNTLSGSIVVDGQPTATAYAGTSTNPITYTAHHALAALPLGSGITESWRYNDRLQATGVTAGGLILNFYPCDGGVTACSNNNGNIWRETAQSPGMTGMATQEYRYDALNRLVVAVENPATGVTPTSTCASGGGSLGGTWCQQFDYDVYGNRWVNAYSATPPANTPTTGSNFDGSNHLTVNGALADASGNLQQIGGTGGIQYTYDGENRLVTVTSLATSTTVASYAYDGEGRRVQRVSGATTTYVYDAMGELAAEYITGTSSVAPCTTCYLTADHLGSTRMMTDNYGNPIALHDYQPFGEEIPAGMAGRSNSLYDQTDNPRQKFTGKERDSWLANSADPYGLDYFGARYFSGAQGRFTSPDSTAYSKMSNPQSWNLYAYSFNNPLRFTDPTGHEVQAAECKTEQDCQNTLAAVRASLSNGQAAARVGIHPIQRGFWGRIGAAITGAPQFRFTISGDTASFRALGQNASRFADLVGTSKVVYAAIGNLAPVPGGSGMMQFAGGVSGTTTQKADPPFAYIKQNPSSEDPDTHGIIGGHFGIIPGANQGETMAHELLGHVWGEMFGGNPAGAAGNLHDSLDAENAVRATDLSRGLKIDHHGERVYTPQEVEKMRKRQ